MTNNRLSDEAIKILEAVEIEADVPDQMSIVRSEAWSDLLGFIRGLEQDLRETKRDLQDVVGPPANEDAANGRLYLAAREFVEFYRNRDLAKAELVKPDL